ncbi:MAG: co-chaperone GroES [Chlamydiota bacterium]
MGQKTQKKTLLKPLGNRVALQRLEEEETLKGPILLPDTAKKKPETATVVAIGQGETTKEGKILPMSVAIGDKVLIEKYAGQEVIIDDEEYIIVKAEELIAAVVEE